MRTKDAGSRAALAGFLARGPATTANLAERLGVSGQTVRRLLAEHRPGEVWSAGPRGNVRHAARRPLRGTLTELPLFEVDEDGRARQLEPVVPVAGGGTFARLPPAWPVPVEARDGWWEGLAYPIHAMRPAGYLGRVLARTEHAVLAVSEDPEAWSDDDVLWVLAHRGVDTPGNLIVGAAAYDRWLRQKVDGVAALATDAVPDAYVRLAADAVASTGNGSSAAGEFPKFTAIRALAEARTPHVIVKFSGGAGSAPERRWADLLVCEHLALESARTLDGIDAPPSRILLHGGRTFLESERFDRIGEHGRRAVCGLDVIDPAFVRSRDSSWPALAGRLLALRLLAAADVAAVSRLWWFGRLIANTDMHTGNLAFHVEGRLRLAPAYDMLPMAYAPLPGGEVPARRFDPPLPQPDQRSHWMAACTAAAQFWSVAQGDARISQTFRAICGHNATRLADLARAV